MGGSEIFIAAAVNAREPGHHERESEHDECRKNVGRIQQSHELTRGNSQLDVD
jgi:hypothetical protein